MLYVHTPIFFKAIEKQIYTKQIKILHERIKALQAQTDTEQIKVLQEKSDALQEQIETREIDKEISVIDRFWLHIHVCALEVFGEEDCNTDLDADALRGKFSWWDNTAKRKLANPLKWAEFVLALSIHFIIGVTEIILVLFEISGNLLKEKALNYRTYLYEPPEKNEHPNLYPIADILTIFAILINLLEGTIRFAAYTTLGLAAFLINCFLSPTTTIIVPIREHLQTRPAIFSLALLVFATLIAATCVVTILMTGGAISPLTFPFVHAITAFLTPLVTVLANAIGTIAAQIILSTAAVMLSFALVHRLFSETAFIELGVKFNLLLTPLKLLEIKPGGKRYQLREAITTPDEKKALDEIDPNSSQNKYRIAAQIAAQRKQANTGADTKSDTANNDNTPPKTTTLSRLLHGTPEDAEVVNHADMSYSNQIVYGFLKTIGFGSTIPAVEEIREITEADRPILYVNTK